MDSKALLARARDLFATYLENNHHRATSERFAVLEAIYQQPGHFEAEELFRALQRKKKRISRATVYNTLELLVDSHLVIRHQFTQQTAHYERALGYRQHDHAFCLACRRVFEFCDPRLHKISTAMSALLNFTIVHQTLILYGYCPKCITKKTVLQGKPLALNQAEK